MILVASNPAIAPDGIDNNGPEDGEFNGDANSAHISQKIPPRMVFVASYKAT